MSLAVFPFVIFEHPECAVLAIATGIHFSWLDQNLYKTDGHHDLRCVSVAFLIQPVELNKNIDSGFSAGLVDDSNPFEWQVILTGPPDTV